MKSTDSSDRELMAEVAAGGAQGVGRLYDRFGKSAYAVAYAVCGDKRQAEDAVREALLTIWKPGASYPPRHGTVAGWLLRTVRLRAIEIARRQNAGPEDRLRVSLARLPEEQREVIILAYYGKLSHSEIASQLGLPPGTVKGRMRLGLHQLQVHLEEATS